MPSLRVRHALSHATAPFEAVWEVAAAVDQAAMRAVLLFCSASYDLSALGAAIRGAFSCPVVACTTAGQIGRAGYQRGGIAAVSVAGESLDVRTFLVAPLRECRERGARVAQRVREILETTAAGRRAFGFLVVDGMALAEEALAAVLCHALGRVPIVGGSAGDDLRFRRTAVYWDGEFLSDAAVFSLFLTGAPFTTFKVQHYAPSETALAITSASPERRLVRRIDGFPAAAAYARVLGLSVSDLHQAVYSRNPLLLRIGSEHYVRSIREANPDGSLTFHSAIDEGLVLRLATRLDPLRVLEERFRQVRGEIGPPALVLACDCVLRRLELEQDGRAERVGEFLARQQVVGFSTYGEQFGALHVNHTMTAVALGATA